MSIFDAAMNYKAEATPLVILAGKEYGTGSSRDWAAKGTMLLGVKAVIAESFERIHRSNLIGMGVLPLQFKDGENVAEPRAHRPGELSTSSASIAARRRSSTVIAKADDGKTTRVRGAPAHRHAQGARLLPHGGILQYVLRQLAAAAQGRLKPAPASRGFGAPGRAASVRGRIARDAARLDQHHGCPDRGAPGSRR